MDVLLLVSALLITLVLALLPTSRTLFYTPDEARRLFGSHSVQELIKSYKPIKCLARSGGRALSPGQMSRQYMLAVRNFSAGKRSRLCAIIDGSPRLRARAWKFVKLASFMDFAFPYTLNDVVVLPSSFLAQHAEREVAVTLLHESFHIDQWAHQSGFDEFYEREWGYVRPRRLTIPCSIWKRIVTDPDGPDIRWVRKLNGAYHWTALVLPGEKSRPVAVAYMCKQTRPGHFVVTSEQRPLASFRNCLFGEVDAYHPNELYASLYSHSLL